MQNDTLRDQLLSIIEAEKKKIIKNVSEFRLHRRNLNQDGYVTWSKSYTQTYMKIMKDGVVKMKEKLLKVLRKKKISEAELTHLLIDPYAIFREVAAERLKEIIEKERQDGET